MKEATFVKSIKSIEEEQVRDGYLQREKSEVKWFLKETSCPLTGGFTKQEMKDMVARTWWEVGSPVCELEGDSSSVGGGFQSLRVIGLEFKKTRMQTEMRAE